MTRSPVGRITLTLATCWLLVACAGSATRDDEAGGFSGSGNRESPADLYVAIAAEYFRQGRLDAALMRSKKALDLDDDSASAHYMIALLYQRMGEYKLAETHFSEAARLEPKNPDIRNALGTFYCSQKRYKEADQQFTKALENPLYNTPWVALTNSGICARQAGDRSKAESYFNRAINANPRFGPALQEMADLNYQRGDYKTARTYLDRYFKSAQATPTVLALAVRVEGKLGARKRASTYKQMLRKSFPNSPEALSL